MRWLLLVTLIASGCALHHQPPPPAPMYVLSGSVADDALFCVERSARESPIAAKVVCVRVGSVRTFLRGLKAAE